MRSPQFKNKQGEVTCSSDIALPSSQIRALQRRNTRDRVRVRKTKLVVIRIWLTKILHNSGIEAVSFKFMAKLLTQPECQNTAVLLQAGHFYD